MSTSSTDSIKKPLFNVFGGKTPPNKLWGPKKSALDTERPTVEAVANTHLAKPGTPEATKKSFLSNFKFFGKQDKSAGISKSAESLFTDGIVEGEDYILPKDSTAPAAQKQEEKYPEEDNDTLDSDAVLTGTSSFKLPDSFDGNTTDDEVASVNDGEIYSAADAEDLIKRSADFNDTPIVSGNSTAAPKRPISDFFWTVQVLRQINVLSRQQV